MLEISIKWIIRMNLTFKLQLQNLKFYEIKSFFLTSVKNILFFHFANNNSFFYEYTVNTNVFYFTIGIFKSGAYYLTKIKSSEKKKVKNLVRIFSLSS